MIPSAILLLSAFLPQAFAAAPSKTILVVADGMGSAGLDYALTEFAKTGAPKIPNIAAFVRKAKASLVSTHSADNLITDSAASATAIACGVKTNNGSLGVDASGKRLICLGEMVKKTGKALGLVTTTDAWDATPGAFSSHVSNRKDSKTIVAQQTELAPDIIWGIDRPGPFTKDDVYQLSKTVVPALEAVSKNPKGFFLLLETERTDEACHANDLPAYIAALEDLDKALGKLLEYASKNPDATIALTSDHDTGGLGVYPDKSAPSWLTKNHTGAPVGLYVIGRGAATLPGRMDNTEIFPFLTWSLGMTVNKNAGNPKPPL